MGNDRMMDLSEDRVDLLRRVFPAVDIRPLDLFPAERNKHIWDLKINHLGRNYDVVGVFNYDEARSEQISLNWKDLGLPENVPVHVYDFWNKEYLGAWENGMTVNLSPTSCRVLTLLPATDKVQLISTSRHITQGWVDLLALNRDDAAIHMPARAGSEERSVRASFRFPAREELQNQERKGTRQRGKCSRADREPPGLGHGAVHLSRTGQLNWSGHVRAGRNLPLSSARTG
jgi:hypothetical protein